MGRKSIDIDRGPLSDAERKRRQRNRDEDITRELQEARTRIDWKRRRGAEKSLEAWICTYGIGVFVDDRPPKPHGSRILSEMEEARTAGRPYQILVGRGGGKTSYAEADAAMCLATGRSKLLVISSINALQAQQIKHEIDAVFTSEPFATDYPDIALPIMLLDGHVRRGQKYCGESTAVKITTDRTILPTIIEEDGAPAMSSGSCMIAKALASVRGTKNGTTRPDKVILDDLQTRDIARNPERVREVLSLVRGDVMGLAGKRKMSITFTATTIERDDVTEMLAADKAWKTTKNPSVMTWPDEWAKDDHGLWGNYFDLYDEENTLDLSHARRGGSLSFYRRNRKAMDAGADILNWGRFDRDNNQISGLQKLMDDYHEMGHDHFMAEHQMEPPRESFIFELTPRTILSRVRKGVPQGTLVNGSVLTVAATDINPSLGLSTCVISFDVALTGLVVAYKVFRTRIDSRLNDVAFNAALTRALHAHADEIASLGIKLDKWGIDGGGRQFRSVTKFTPLASSEHGLNAIAMLGRAGGNWNPYVRSRIREAVNDTVLCRDVGGAKWLAWNADKIKERAQRAWGTDIGGDGGLSIFDGGVNHSRFAIQIANEKLVEKTRIRNTRGTGEDAYAYKWKVVGDNHFGDTVAMCYALALSKNLTGDTGRSPVAPRHRRKVYNG